MVVPSFNPQYKTVARMHRGPRFDTDSKMTPLRILIADDHDLIREGIRAAVDQQGDMEVVGEASSGHEAMVEFERLLPDVLLLDIEMPVQDGLAVLEAIRHGYPGACVVILTSYAGDARIFRALEAGARGYVLKSASRAFILEALRTAAAGGQVLSIELETAVPARVDARRLHPREVRCLGLAADGLGNLDIAQRLGTSPETVKTRLKSAFRKLGARDRAHAVVLAIQQGYV
jgi:DNA-binding NarL/FixJ family response regulator